MEILIAKYPHLFQEVVWPWGPTRARFELLESAPADELISNVNIVPCIGDQWVMLRLRDGSWEIPGGTLEAGEKYMDTLQRELREEVGARLLSFQIIGAWQCHSLAEKPYRPHLPFPDYYRLAGWGEIEVVQPPQVPPEGEAVVLVESMPMELAMARFTIVGRHDLAELYQLANIVRTNRRLG